MRLAANLRSGRDFGEKPVKIGRGGLGEGFGGHAAPLREDAGGLGDVSGFVAFAAMGRGREIRRVGLDEDALKGNLVEDAPQGLGAFEGRHPRKGETSPYGQSPARQLPA